MTNEALQVLIVDDHPLFRSGMRTLLEAEPDMVVVGEATAARKRSRWQPASSPTLF